MLSAYMLVIYFVIFALSLYMAVKYCRIELGHVRKIVARARSTITRLVMMYTIILLLAKKSFTFVIISIIALALLISSFSAASNTAVTAFPLERPCIDCGKQAILVEFAEPLNTSCSTIIRILSNDTDLGGIHCQEFIRIVLSDPLVLNVSKFPIYVLIGIEKDFSMKVFGMEIDEGELVYGGELPTDATSAEITLSNGTTLSYLVFGKDPGIIANLTMIDSIPLLPIEAYLGAKPVLPPPKYVLIGGMKDIEELAGLPKNYVTDVLLVNFTKVTDPAKMFSALSQTYPVSKVSVIHNDVALVASSTQVPTMDSLLVAVVSSFMAVVLATSLFTSVIPYVKDLYRKLSYGGFPPWAMTIVLSIYVSMLAWGVGIPILVYSYVTVGSVSAFNVLISALIVWVIMLAYVNYGAKPASLMTDVYTPPTPRYVVVSKIRDIKTLTEVITRIIRTNEFFETQEIESRISGNEALIHARMNYVESWGSGVDLNIMINREEESTFISINTHVWGIEEISENVTKNMIALAISRIVGGVKAWESK